MLRESINATPDFSTKRPSRDHSFLDKTANSKYPTPNSVNKYQSVTSTMKKSMVPQPIKAQAIDDDSILMLNISLGPDRCINMHIRKHDDIT